MESFLQNRKLERNFYTRDLLPVAKDLLGKILVKNSKNTIYAGKIVEVEAYDGATDQAAHTFIGRTPRNEVMFKEGGYLYVYFTYGMYFCCNVVAGLENEGKAILLRAVEPIAGIENMAVNRFNKDKINQKEFLNLTSGPGKLCKAYNIKRIDNGTDLTKDEIYILESEKVNDLNIGVSKRIGIKKSVDLPWRFFIKDNSFVSR